MSVTLLAARLRNGMVLVLALILVMSRTTSAQQPIGIQRASAQGAHLEAIVQFEKLPRIKRSPDVLLAAARSAWALSLPTYADELYEQALQTKDLPEDIAAQALLSRGVIAYQEGKYQVAALFAERSTKGLKEPSPLRSRAWILWGEALTELNQLGSACEKYEAGLKETDSTQRGNVEAKLGFCLFGLGKSDEAALHLKAIPLDNADSPRALRLLAESAVNAERYDDASFWLATGRKYFPDEFLDSFTEYVSVRESLTKGDDERVNEILAQAEKKYGTVDEWVVLARAFAARERATRGREVKHG